jgi:hypothetical protein
MRHASQLPRLADEMNLEIGISRQGSAKTCSRSHQVESRQHDQGKLSSRRQTPAETKRSFRELRIRLFHAPSQQNRSLLLQTTARADQWPRWFAFRQPRQIHARHQALSPCHKPTRGWVIRPRHPDIVSARQDTGASDTSGLRDGRRRKHRQSEKFVSVRSPGLRRVAARAACGDLADLWSLLLDSRRR